MEYNKRDLDAEDLQELEFPYRKSIRLENYDYSAPGLYFVTICAQNRKCLLGRYVDGELEMNDAGKMVENVWSDIPVYYSGFDVREFVVMPNHVHGIVEIIQSGNGRARGPAGNGLARDEDGRVPVPPAYILLNEAT